VRRIGNHPLWLEITTGATIRINRKEIKEVMEMKISIPSLRPGGLEADVSAHFGHCELFTAVEIDENEIKKVWTIDNKGEHNCMIPVQKMRQEGIDTVLIGGIGRKPLMEFQRMGIRVHFGANGTVKNAVSDFLNDCLKEATMEDVCHGDKCH
jgi:predicted Fe-Mo cluster-binding NifX family protein